jgi:hypothetical protein
MLAAIARLKRDGLIRVLDSPFPFRDVRESDSHALDNRFGRFDHIADD